MKFISIILFLAVSSICNAQLTEYRMLFPFPFSDDSLSERHIHHIQVQTFARRDSAHADMIFVYTKSYHLDDAAKLLGTYVSKCEGCVFAPDFLSNNDSAKFMSTGTKYNSHHQLMRQETANGFSVYGYDNSGRISFNSVVKPISTEDTSYQDTYHHYATDGKPDWSVRYSYLLHSNENNNNRDTVSTSRTYAKYFYAGRKLKYVIAGMPFKNSNDGSFIINYKYIDRNHWEIRFIENETKQVLYLWKLEESE